MKIDSSATAQASTLNTSKGSKESVGDIANRVANSGKPTGRRVQGQGSPQLDKDAFFKLMLAQVKNQDPTNPVKNHEMAAQLAQFSSLEQMSNVNQTLKAMQKDQGDGMQFQALDLMGKVVRGDNSKISRATGDSTHDLSFNLKEEASEVNLSIANAQGEVIKKMTLQNAPKGSGKVQWDGKAEDGAMAPAGTYKVSIDAKNANGQKVGTETEFSGKVTGVQFTEAGPIVSIGKKTVSLKDIKQIEEENPQKNLQTEMAVASLQNRMPSFAQSGSPLEQQTPGLEMVNFKNNFNSVNK